MQRGIQETLNRALRRQQAPTATLIHAFWARGGRLPGLIFKYATPLLQDSRGALAGHRA